MATDRPAADEARLLLRVTSPHSLPVRRFYLGVGEHLVGASSEAAVRLPAEGVSRRHARLEVLADGGVLVEDLESRNGTWFDRRRIRRAALGGGERLIFGAVEVELVALETAEAGIVIPAAERPPPLSTAIRAAASSTLGYSLEERMLRALARALRQPPAARPLLLAKSFLEELPLNGVEVVCTVGSEEVLLARCGAVEGEPGVEVADGAAAVRLWGAAAAFLARREALAGLLTAVLAPSASDGASGGGSSAAALAPGGRGGGTAGAASPPGAPEPAAGEAAPQTGAVPLLEQGTDDSTPTSTTAADLPPPGSLNPEVQGLYRRAGRIAAGEVPVLVRGESGSGKEVLARWIHRRSARRDGPFVALNCAALPAELLEAELFGIERGVATGVEARRGLLEQASGGTLFLDEIGDMPAATQAKLLRVLEDRNVYRVGGRSPVAIDVRFVAATHQQLETAIDEGRFRRDLFHRLAAFEAELPPLRRRREDIPLLAAHFFHRERRRSAAASPGISRGALAALCAYDWPGNVRQLANEIAQAVLLLEPGEPLLRDHLSRRLREALEGEEPPSLALATALRHAERQAYATALAAADGDASRATELLEVSRATFYRRLKELGLKSDG